MRYLVMVAIGTIGVVAISFNQYQILTAVGILVVAGCILVSFGNGYCNTIESMSLCLKRHADNVRAAHAKRSVEITKGWGMGIAISSHDTTFTPMEIESISMAIHKDLKLNGHA